MKKEKRIRKQMEFEQIIKNRKFFASPGIVLYTKKRKEDHARVGITVKKKIGNAVIRNKVKRQVRMMVDEIYDFDENFDSVILIKEKFKNNSYMENKKTLETLYLKAKQCRIKK